MPVNFQQIYARVKEIAEGANESKRILEERRNQARELLSFYAADLDYLRQKVEAAKAVDANIRCATPFKRVTRLLLPAACFRYRCNGHRRGWFPGQPRLAMRPSNSALSMSASSP